MAKRILLLATVVAMLASCTSFQRSWDKGGATSVAGLINSGKSGELASLCSVPFLLDGEIVNLRSDVASFWNGVAKAGYHVEGADLESGSPLDADSYKQFANTMEVRSFFAQYVKNDARVLLLRTSKGKHILLIYQSAWFSRHLYGFKGPF